jgi:hypothetical protein
MAADAVRTATDILRREYAVRSGAYYTQHVPLPGAPDKPFSTFLRDLTARAAALGVDAPAAEHLARAYGSDALRILRDVAGDATLGEPLVPGQPYLWAEVRHAVEAEMALTLEDVLRRRLHLFYEAEDGGLSVVRAVAERMTEMPGIGWDANRIDAEIASYTAAVERTRTSVAAPTLRIASTGPASTGFGARVPGRAVRWHRDAEQRWGGRRTRRGAVRKGGFGNRGPRCRRANLWLSRLGVRRFGRCLGTRGGWSRLLPRGLRQRRLCG